MNRTCLMVALIVAAGAGLVCPRTARAQVNEDAKKVILDSQNALNSIEGMTYKIKKSGTGMLKDIIDLTGSGKFWRPKGASQPTIWVDGRMKEPGKPDHKVILTSDGVMAKWLNYENNTCMERSVHDQAATEALGAAKEFLITDVTEGSAYDNILKQPNLSKQGVNTVNGDLCDIIVGVSEDKSRIFTYAIGIADHLPRRIKMATGEGESEIAFITDISDVKPATFTAKDFNLACPPGFVPDVQQNPNAPVKPPELGMKVGTSAPDFEAKTTSGDNVSLASFKGKVLVMQFFGSMFKASAIGSADMQALADEFKGQPVAFVGLACRELSDNGAADFFAKNKLSYELVPKGDTVAQAYDVPGYPSYYVVSPDGKIVGFFQDNPGKDKLKAAIETALKK